MISLIAVAVEVGRPPRSRCTCPSRSPARRRAGPASRARRALGARRRVSCFVAPPLARPTTISRPVAVQVADRQRAHLAAAERVGRLRAYLPPAAVGRDLVAAAAGHDLEACRRRSGRPPPRRARPGCRSPRATAARRGAVQRHQIVGAPDDLGLAVAVEVGHRGRGVPAGLAPRAEAAAVLPLQHGRADRRPRRRERSTPTPAKRDKARRRVPNPWPSSASTVRPDRTASCRDAAHPRPGGFLHTPHPRTRVALSRGGRPGSRAKRGPRACRLVLHPEVTAADARPRGPGCRSPTRRSSASPRPAPWCPGRRSQRRRCCWRSRGTARRYRSGTVVGRVAQRHPVELQTREGRPAGRDGGRLWGQRPAEVHDRPRGRLPPARACRSSRRASSRWALSQVIAFEPSSVDWLSPSLA